MEITTFVIIIFGLLAWALIQQHSNNKKENAQLAQIAQEEKEEKKRELEKRTREIEERKYNLIINCPQCNGLGLAVYLYYYHRDGRSERRWGPQSELNNCPVSFTNDEGDNVDYAKDTCAYCGGNGIAYAYYEKKESMCMKCYGKGKIINQNRVKRDIGVDIITDEHVCTACEGTGMVPMEYLYVKCSVSEAERKKGIYWSYIKEGMLQDRQLERVSNSKGKNDYFFNNTKERTDFSL